MQLDSSVPVLAVNSNKGVGPAQPAGCAGQV